MVANVQEYQSLPCQPVPIWRHLSSQVGFVRIIAVVPTFDVAQTTGWTGSEQKKQVEQTAILSRLKQLNFLYLPDHFHKLEPR